MQFSRRTAWELHPNPYSERLDSLRARGEALLDLTETNPTACGLTWPQETLGQLLSGGDVTRYQPEPFGLLEAREAVAKFWSRAGAPVIAGEVMLTASTSEAYSHLFKLLCDPGDAVVCFTPGYPLLDHLAQLECVRLLPLATELDGSLPLHELEELCQREQGRVRAVVLVNPGNPLGRFVPGEDVRALAELCARHGAALICDEVFAHSAFDPQAPHRTVAGLEWPALTFALSGLSKVAALPGWKVGWTWLGGPAPLRDAAKARLEVIADAYLSVSTPAQRALPGLLSNSGPIQAALRDRVLTNRRTLASAHGPHSPWNLLPAEAGWAAVLRIPTLARKRGQVPFSEGNSRAAKRNLSPFPAEKRNLSPFFASDEVTALELLDAGVVVHPGHFYELPPSHLVLSCLPEPAVFSEGIRRVVARLDAAR